MFDQSRSHLPNLFSKPGIGGNIFWCCLNVVMNMDLLCALVALKDKDTLLFLPIADIIARCKDKNYVWLANALTLPVQGEVPKEDDLLPHLDAERLPWSRDRRPQHHLLSRRQKM